MKKPPLLKLFLSLISLVPVLQAQTVHSGNDADLQACMAKHFGQATVIARSGTNDSLEFTRCTDSADIVCHVSEGIRAKNYEGITCLVNAGFDFNVGSGELLFHAGYWDFNVLKLLFGSKHPPDLEARNKFDKTLLLSLSTSLSSKLINRGRNFSWENVHKSIEFLLELGANPDAATKDGMTSLMHQASYGQNEIIKLLLRSGSDPNRQTREGKTALMLSSDNTDRLRMLLDAGANIRLKDKDGRTAIHYAIEGCQIEKVKMLIAEEPAILDEVGADGKSVLDDASLPTQGTCSKLEGVIRR